LSALPLAKPFLIPPETPVPDLVETLMRSAVSKALVVDADQKLLGIVTLFDLLKGGRKEG
jgi:NADH dehydrogenase